MKGLFALVIIASVVPARAQVEFDHKTGSYTLHDRSRQLFFAGSIPGPVDAIRNTTGKDQIGNYEEVSFDWNEGGKVHGTIRWYQNLSTAWFRAHYTDGQRGKGVVFPKFAVFPADYSQVSFQDEAFATPRTGLAETSTPWLFFNRQKHAFIFSPASQFMVAKMTGDGKTSIGEGLNLRLSEVPQGFNQDSILVLGNGIGNTWDTWGAAMRRLYKRTDVRYDADVLLNKFGYWTDNGADYYYNYDPALGYANTLLAVRKRYDEEGIPISYLQLDSWWYSKTLNDASGRPGKPKNSKLPEGSWNRYGGLLEYVAHPDLFPTGLSGFENQLRLPLATHNRWIDKRSPYHQYYAISGVGAVDPKWWRDIAAYLKSGGVEIYEQDWLSSIYANSPEMARTVGPGDAFADGMANAMAKEGLTMQYCMATPRFFLQGVKYPNLTTIRTSGDRFEPRKWADFLFLSQFATEMGIAPWCDVFKSSETGNLILSVLSCGPVGTGDALGKEDIANIHRAVRADGVIVKPDRAILPADDSWMLSPGVNRDDQGTFWADTYTKQQSRSTGYLFGFGGKNSALDIGYWRRQFGIAGRCYLLDLTTKEGGFVTDQTVDAIAMTGGNYAYLMLAPELNGITFLGDLSLITPTGKQRIGKVSEENGGLRITVHFAKLEKSVTLSGVCAKLPRQRAIKGTVGAVSFDEGNGRFSVEVHPPTDGQDAVVWIDP